jgi:hypothetical protein
MAISDLDPLVSGFSALIVPPAPKDPSKVWVDGRRLFFQAEGEFRPYRDSDFVLLNVVGTESRGDENVLPFSIVKQDALNALWDGDEGLKRAKANLVAAYQQMRKSPDLTSLESEKLFEQWMVEFKTERDRLARWKSLPIERRPPPRQDPLSNELNAAVKRIEL